MNRVASLAALVVGLWVAGTDIWGLSVGAAVQSQGNDYFDALVARADHWKSYSFRDPKQLTYKNQGGYSVESSTSGAKLWITYDAAMDAAKVVIPPFMPGCTLTAPVGASDTTLPLSCGIGGYWNGGTKRAVRVEQEIMAIVPPAAGAPPNTLTVIRGSFGTSAAAHTAGANAEWNTNSVQSQVRVPLGTSDGSSYFFTWDGLWTDTYLNSGLTNHKAFQFGSDGIWLEPQTNFSGLGKPGFSQATDVAVLSARSYAPAADPINPRLAAPTIYPNRWTRFWVRINQRADDSELMSMWMADDVQEPVQIYKDIPIYARPVSIQDFWLEYNTSTDSYVRGPGARNFVSYVRNFVALRNPGDVSSLLIRPAAGIPIPGGSIPIPGAPANLRVIR